MARYQTDSRYDYRRIIMTVDEKLKELGYKKSRYSPLRRKKEYDYEIVLYVEYETFGLEEDFRGYLRVESFIEMQEYLNAIQKAFNILQSDLKEIREEEGGEK